MNFFDYELSRTSTVTPPQTAGEASNDNEPSLNDEVSQVVGQLGRLWGGFRKQSQAALETARKDFSSVVAQAQKEIEKLRTDANVPVADADNTEASTSTQGAEPSLSEKDTPSESQADEDETTPQPSSPSAGPSSSPFPFQTLLSRVQASLPPNISATLERTIPAALKDPASHAYADIQHLRETLGAEFVRVQGVTRAQAEEYVQRSEAVLRDAGAYLKENVRLIPPEEQEPTGEADVAFDGMGLGVIVMPPSMRSTAATRSKGKGRETVSQAQQRLAGSRAAAMLAQLKRDPETIKKDPLEDEDAKELYEAWLNSDISSKEDGIESTYWTQRTKETLDGEDADLLRSTRDALVPSVMDSKTFWTRYFFRIHLIEKDEEKRKALLAASGEGNDEDFSWEDDDDESVTPSEPAGQHAKESHFSPAAKSPSDIEHSSQHTLQPAATASTLASYPESLVTSPSNTSPRESSDGYDVVSPSRASGANGKASESKEKKETKPALKAEMEKKDDNDDADSDWE